MIKSVKRLGAAVLSAVIMLTAVATPLGDNLPAVRDSVSLTAGADTYWVGSSKYGYYANNSTALNEVKAIMSKKCSSSEIARFNKILSEFPLSGYFNSYKTKACSWHCGTELTAASSCRNNFYDDETGKTLDCTMTDWTRAKQCAGYAVYCYYRFMGKTTADIITLPKGFTADQLKSVFSDKTIRTGAHFRKLPGHSLCYLTRDDNYIYFIDANSGYNSATGCTKGSCGHYVTCCKINLHKYTYKEFASACSSGKLTIYNSSTSKFDSGSTPSTDNVKLTGTSYKIANTVSDTNAFVVTDVYKPSNYKLTKAGIRIRRDDSSYDNGWSEFHNTASTWTGYDYMRISYDMNSEVKITLRHGTKYYYKFYAVIEGKEYWSPEQSFTTTGSHSFGSWYTKTAATCTSGGVEEHKCSCGKTETRSTSALGHNFGTTYFEAAHPHYYGHKCSRCGYSEKTGGNLAIYEKCDICYNENLPGKPSLNISSNGFNETDNVSFTWNDTEKTTHYVLTVAVLSGDEYKTVCRETYVNSGFQTTFGKGQYRALLQSYNSNMFHQYSSDWRDWVHNNSEYVYFNIDCAHEYLGEVVSPTFDREGYTQYTCTKCGDSYISDYTAKLTLSKVTNFKVKSLTSTNVTLQWNKNANASGYEIEQYKDSKWVKIATVDKNSTVRYTVKGLKAGTAGYQFRIRAYRNESIGKVYSAYSSTVKVNTNPYGVGEFKCSSKTSTSVTLKWNKGTTASGYQLQQYKDGKWVTIYTGTKATNTSYTVKGLKAGTAGYRFRIRAYKTYGSSKQYGSWSSEVKVNTNPYGVGGFKAKSRAKTSITLGWNKGTTASGYQLQQYKGGKWVTVYTGTKATSTSYTVKSLKSNTSYKFRIRAYKTYGSAKQYGSWSKELTVRTKR